MNRPTSLYLDLVRPIAALIVMLSHVSQTALTDGQMAVFAYTGTEAVDVFFVLSGFVIAHVCARGETDWRDYAISRATRIYSVAMPALLLTAAVDAIGLRHDPSIYEAGYQPFTPGLVLRSVLFLGEQWNSHRFPGSDGPYWSLGFEVWYYVAFGVFMFAPRGWRWLGAAATLAFIGPKVAVLFPIWLMGVAAYRMVARGGIDPRLGWALFGVPILGVALFFALPHSRQLQFYDLAWTARTARRGGTRLSDRRVVLRACRRFSQRCRRRSRHGWSETPERSAGSPARLSRSTWFIYRSCTSSRRCRPGRRLRR